MEKPEWPKPRRNSPEALKGTHVHTHKLDTKTGKLEPIKKKRSPPQMYAAKNKRKWRAAK